MAAGMGAAVPVQAPDVARSGQIQALNLFSAHYSSTAKLANYHSDEPPWRHQKKRSRASSRQRAL